jgi:uncharacterized membrane protein YgcG
MVSTNKAAALVAVCGLGLAAGPCLGQNLQDRINHVMQRKAAAETQNATKSQLLGTLLYTDISVQFQDNNARDAINHIETVLGINIVGRYSDDRTGTGLDPEAPITLNVVNKPALTVLEMILDQAAGDEEATWQLREGYVEVGTKERLASGSALEIRYYSIKDLLFTAPQFNNAPALDLNNALNQGQNQRGGGGGGGGGAGGGSGGGGGNQGNIFGNSQPEEPRMTEAERAQQIIDLIVETVEPDGWDISGGTWATIRYYQGTLIIKAPDFIHRQIGGYPFAIRPVLTTTQASGPRYVMFTGGVSTVELAGIETQRFTGAAGGNNFGGGGGGGNGGGDGGNAPAGNNNNGAGQSTPSGGK